MRKKKASWKDSIEGLEGGAALELYIMILRIRSYIWSLSILGSISIISERTLGVSF